MTNPHALGAGRIRHVRLEWIDPSPYQVRLVFPDAEIERLAESVLASGIIHPPRGRPHPSRPGRVELMPGEMRVRALARLVDDGRAGPVLRQDGEGHWLVPVLVGEADDEDAERIVASENADRTDLSPWEWARAYAARRERRRLRGLPAGVRDVAASVGGARKFQTVAEYLQVADALTPEVLGAAGVLRGEEPDHPRLALLPLAALGRVARAAARSRTAGAECLLGELARAGDRMAVDHLAGRARALQSGAPTGAEAGFQMNIRSPLVSLGAHPAARYLSRMAPAVELLAARAAGMDAESLEPVAAALVRAAELLRAGAAHARGSSRVAASRRVGRGLRGKDARVP